MSLPRVILAIVIVATFALVVVYGFNGLTAETTLKSASSPDGLMIAQVTNFDHGAMAASLLTITVGSKHEKDRNRDVMFAVDGICKIDNIAWVSDRKLHVDYDCPPGMIQLAIMKKDGITMEYLQEPLPPIHSSFVP
jgi:hypothetical protein